MHASWVVTVGAILSWAALSAVSRILLLRFEFDPWSFSFVQLCSGGILLLAMAGKGSLAMTSFRRPITWLLGSLRVLSAAIYTAVLAWVSVLEAGILGSMSVPLIAIVVWMIFGRRAARGEWLGHLAILVAIVLLVVNLDGGIRFAVLWLMLLNALCLVLISILAERHPENVSDQPGARLGFTGAVLLVTAGLFLTVRFVQGGPSTGIWDWWFLVSGTSVGIALRAPAMVLAFWSIRLIGAQNYMGAISFLPIAGMVFEELAFELGLIDVSRFQSETLFLAIGVIIGTLMVFFARMRAAHAKQPETALRGDYAWLLALRPNGRASPQSGVRSRSEMPPAKKKLTD